jgi:hypothetical protein
MSKTFCNLAVCGVVAMLFSFPVGEVLAETKTATPEAQVIVKNNVARISGAVISNKSDNSLTVTHDGQSRIVNISATTKLRRRFWGNATMTEISVGDIVNVWGKWTDENQSAINATLVRDTSIQKRFGVFVGTISAASPSGWIVDTFNRGRQTVAISPNTKMVDRTNKPMAQESALVGNRVRVRGLWNNTVNTVTEVVTVKNYSVPEKAAAKTATSSATP